MRCLVTCSLSGKNSDHGLKDTLFISIISFATRVLGGDFKSLKNSIPTETMIAMGEPANKNGAGESSIFYGSDADKDIYNLIMNQLVMMLNLVVQWFGILIKMRKIVINL